MATSNGILARLFAATRLTRAGRLVAGLLRRACALVRRILRQGPARADGADRESTAVDGHPGQFVSGSYANKAGSRPYKLYIPTSYAEERLPLVVMLHGCSQTADAFANGT